MKEQGGKSPTDSFIAPHTQSWAATAAKPRSVLFAQIARALLRRLEPAVPYRLAIALRDTSGRR